MSISPIKVTISASQIQTALQSDLIEVLDEAKKDCVATSNFLNLCNKYGYVPVGTFSEIDYGRKSVSPGELRKSGRFDEDYVIWGEGLPYARYIYEGKVYGPNIPITKMGQVVGFYSIPGRRKSPTGANIQYHGGPRVARHWDKQMIKERRDEFNSLILTELNKIAAVRSNL